MIARAALVTVVLLGALGSGARAATPRIVGGQPASASDLPFVAGMEIAVEGAGNDGPDALCAGSLIAARWVLTAAHCIVEEPVDVQNSYAVLGATNLNAETADQRYQWAQAIPAPGYASGTGGSDVGLVRLARPSANTQLRLARTGDAAAAYASGAPVVTAGWGYTEDQLDGGAISTSQLRAVGVNVVGDADCGRAFADAGAGGSLEFDTEVCAIADGRDSCNGDSGGPLMYADTGGLPALVGAVSFGIGSGNLLRGDRSCNEGPPGVYARVASEPLNSFIRSYVPQVELDRNVPVPVPGQAVTFTALPRAPGGDGPFNGYDQLAWDTDGDNVFGERTGQRSATVRATAPATTIAVRATTDEGDAEIRRVRIPTQAKSAVSFARSSAQVRRGRSVGLRIARVGSGSGGATVSVSGSGVTPRRRTVDFSGDESARTVRVRARRRGGDRTVTVRLGAYTGDVVGGTRTKLKLKVRAAR